MKTKPSRIVSIILLGCVLSTIAWLTLRQNEPVYEGKSLSAWLTNYAPGAQLANEQADVAIRHIGTNAIPILLRRLKARDTTLSWRWRAFAIKHHLPNFPSVLPWQLRAQGSQGFKALGSKARDAVPALIDLYERGDFQTRPFLASAIGAIGPDAKSAVPALLKGLTDANPGGANCTAWALVQIHAEPQVVVPALINCLTNKNGYFRDEIVMALGAFGSDAKLAIPALVALRKDINPIVRNSADTAIQQIDPDPPKINWIGGLKEFP